MLGKIDVGVGGVLPPHQVRDRYANFNEFKVSGRKNEVNIANLNFESEFDLVEVESVPCGLSVDVRVV